MTTPHAALTAPDADEINALALAAIAALPLPYRVAAEQIALRIEDFASDQRAMPESW